MARVLADWMAGSTACTTAGQSAHEMVALMADWKVRLTVDSLGGRMAVRLDM